MKQKLLTLFVLLVSAMTAFADAKGSGVTKGNDSNKNGISYEYQFTEQDGNVTFTVTPNLDGIIGYAGTFLYDENRLQGDYETHNTTRTWTGLAKGTEIKVKGWFDAAGGRMWFDEVTYTTSTEAAPDTEKPVMVKADATTIRDTRATLTLLANDDSNGLLTYKVTIGENSYTGKGNAGKDVTIDITGLTAETKYDFSVTATDEANNVSEAKTGSFTTTTAFTLTAPTAPTVDANKVISVLSAAYTPATTWNFGGWSQSTVSENIDVDGTPIIHLSKFNYIGLDGFSNQLDLSGMTHMHIDVLPVTMEGSLGVTPILASGSVIENSKKVGDKTTLKLGQWNAIDMPLSDFGLDFINNKVFQIKFDQGNNATDELYIANIYFYKNTEAAPDTEKPVMVKADATTIRDTRATLTLLANDDSNGLLTYKVTIGENSYTGKGNAGKDVTIDITGLTAETKYDFSVTATDEANNVSEAKTGSFTTTTAFTLTAPTAPTVDANKVISVLSAAYTPATTWNFGGWSQSTVSENIDVDGTPIIHLSKFNYIGLDGFSNQLDLSGMTHMHIDVLPVTMEGSLGVTPILASGSVIENSKKVGDKTTLKLGQWNAIDMPLSDFGLDFINNKVFQIKFDKGNNATDELYIANIYFYKKSADEIDVTINGNVAKVTGPITTANVEEINNKDVMNIDLTGVKSIEDGVTIQPLRKNAIIVISGTYKEEKINEETVCTTTADSKFDAIKDMKNVVALAADGYYHPLKQLEFVDIPGEPLWTGGLKDIISTGNTGWKVTRTIPAHTHATVCVTNSIENIPANLSAWEAVDYDETTGIKFNKANVIGGNYPYVVRNATDEDTDLSFTGTNNLNFKTIMDTEANKHKVGSTNIYFRGNWKETLVTDGTQWIIKNEGINASIVKANGTKISPFRAYFTGIPEGASAKLNFIDGEATGINGVNAEAAADGAIYNLAGQKVSAAYKGIVIKNGKKYLMK